MVHLLDKPTTAPVAELCSMLVGFVMHQPQLVETVTPRTRRVGSPAGTLGPASEFRAFGIAQNRLGPFKPRL